jgi:fucose 4-O-acetylase-like acetyltransferase
MGRITWIDATKGYAIWLVVFGHVLGGAIARGWLSGADGNAPKLIYDYIYSFHMPLFFIISGALGIKGIRDDPRRAIVSRAGSIAWPYVFWGIVSILLLPMISQFTLNPVHDLNFYEAFKGGVKGLLLGQSSWFLWTLFLTQCVLISALQVASIPTVFVLSVFVFLVLANKDLGTLSTLIRFMPFLALGAVIGRRIDLMQCGSKTASIAVGTLLAGALFVLVFLRLNETPILSLCCGIIGSVALLIIAKSLGTTGANLLMANCGAASLVVFLLHPYFQGTARELILRAMGPSIWWQLAIPTVAGVVGPTLIWLGAERLGLQWLFRLDLNRLILRRERGRADRQVRA